MYFLSMHQPQDESQVRNTITLLKLTPMHPLFINNGQLPVYKNIPHVDIRGTTPQHTEKTQEIMPCPSTAIHYTTSISLYRMCG